MLAKGVAQVVRRGKIVVIVLASKTVQIEVGRWRTAVFCVAISQQEIVEDLRNAPIEGLLIEQAVNDGAQRRVNRCVVPSCSGNGPCLV